MSLETNPLLQKKKKKTGPLCGNVEQYKILPSDDKKTVNRKHGTSYVHELMKMINYVTSMF